MSNLKIRKVKVETPIDVYDITVENNHNFFADEILVHNCEIDLPSSPFEDINNGDGLISLCTLSAINWGNFDKPEDMEEACDLAVRALDAILDYQDYPVVHAERATKLYRPLGVGIMSLAYFLAKRGLKYDTNALSTINEWSEAWSYYLIKASVNLAKEKGRCDGFNNTKYSLGLFPHDTYKSDSYINEVAPYELKQDWDALREEMVEHGIRNATLHAIMPGECQSWDNKLNTVEYGNIDFHELCEKYGINYEDVERNGIPDSYNLAQPLKINTANGEKEATRLYYNGNYEIYKLTFDDGNEYSFTGNHQLKVIEDGVEFWCRVDMLTENMEVVNINEKNKG